MSKCPHHVSFHSLSLFVSLTFVAHVHLYERQTIKAKLRDIWNSKQDYHIYTSFAKWNKLDICSHYLVLNHLFASLFVSLIFEFHEFQLIGCVYFFGLYFRDTIQLTSRKEMELMMIECIEKRCRYVKLEVNEPLQIACYEFENRIGRLSLKKDSSGLSSEFTLFIFFCLFFVFLAKLIPIQYN